MCFFTCEPGILEVKTFRTPGAYGISGPLIFAEGMRKRQNNSLRYLSLKHFKIQSFGEVLHLMLFW